MRLELDYTFRKDANNVSKAECEILGLVENYTKVRSQTLMAKAYYDINTNTAWTPYLSAGAGLSHLSLKQQAFSSSEEDDGDILLKVKILSHGVLELVLPMQSIPTGRLI